MMERTRATRWLLGMVAVAWGVGSAGMALAVAEIEPAAAELAEELPQVGSEPAPRVMQAEEAFEAAPAPAAAATEAIPGVEGRVARSSFTSEVLDREPLGQVTALENDITKISYFTELQGLNGQQVTHRWEYDGASMAEVAFEVRGERWRVHSTKTLDPSWLGTWTVTVLDRAGRELSRESFDYVLAGGSEPAATSPAAPTPSD